MFGVVGQVLPLALASALSSVPILAVLTILIEGRRRSSAVTFMLGYLVGLLIVAALFSAGIAAAPSRDKPGPQPLIAWGSLAVGAGLFAYAAYLLRTRGRIPTRDRTGSSRLLRLLGRITPLPALGVGLVLTLRPKALLLAAAVGIVVGPAKLTPVGILVALLVYVVIGGSTVGGPIVFSLARPDIARKSLQASRGWIVGNARVVSIVVVTVVAVVVIGNGLSRF
jgi:Sap, sulfolipid-1-addressing protein